LQTVRMILKKHGLDVHHRDISGRNILHVAAQHCHSSILGLLLKLSIDINLQDKHGRTPLHLAASLHTASLHSRLSTSASGNGKFKMVKLNRPPLPVVNFPLPVNKGKNLVDVEKEYLRTWKKTDGIRPFPLEEQIKCCNLLVRAGADRKIEDEQGQKPIDLCSNKEESLISILNPGDDEPP